MKSKGELREEYRKLNKKKFEIICRLMEWDEKLKVAQKTKNKGRAKEIENTMRQLEENLINILKEIDKLKIKKRK